MTDVVVEAANGLLRCDPAAEARMALVVRRPATALRLWLDGRWSDDAACAEASGIDPETLPLDERAVSRLSAEASLTVVCSAGDRFAESALRRSGLTGTSRPRKDGDPKNTAPRAAPKDFVRAMRPHQWSKNLLVLVPVLLAHFSCGMEGVLRAAGAAAAFCLAASCAYLLNDLCDLPADRAHPTKHRRPLAKGDLSVREGLSAAAASGLCACALALASGGASTAGVLAVYWISTCAYSFHVKKHAVADACALAILYDLRLLAGAEAAGVDASSWLSAICLFLFMSLAAAKRYAEAKRTPAGGGRIAGRGWRKADLGFLESLGVSCGNISVLVLAIYLTSDDVRGLYAHPKILWAACPAVLLWINRTWLVTRRGGMHDDPVVFAAKDPFSWATAAFVGAAGWLAA